jgi:nucleotide-binding universal stress UspA family protein
MSQSPASCSTPAKILLPIDFSASSDAAFEMATKLAQCFHSDLYLVHIISTEPDFNGSDFFPETSILQEVRSGISEQLATYEASLRSKGIKTFSSIETGDDVAGNIMLVIEREHIDMLVISTHGISGWRPMVFGSIAEKVIKTALCPVLLLHSPKPVTISETGDNSLEKDKSSNQPIGALGTSF